MRPGDNNQLIDPILEHNIGGLVVSVYQTQGYFYDITHPEIEPYTSRKFPSAAKLYTDLFQVIDSKFFVLTKTTTGVNTNASPQRSTQR